MKNLINLQTFWLLAKNCLKDTLMYRPKVKKVVSIKQNLIFRLGERDWEYKCNFLVITETVTRIA